MFLCLGSKLYGFDLLDALAKADERRGRANARPGRAIPLTENQAIEHNRERSRDAFYALLRASASRSVILVQQWLSCPSSKIKHGWSAEGGGSPFFSRYSLTKLLMCLHIVCISTALLLPPRVGCPCRNHSCRNVTCARKRKLLAQSVIIMAAFGAQSPRVHGRYVHR